jgi:hypothetical protein
METAKTYENFPAWIPVVSNSVTILIWAAGFVIMLRLGWVAAAVYLAFVASLEYRLISRHCVNCYYWGRTCGFGQGRLSELLFKKGDSEKFCSGGFSWKDMIPDLLVSLVPLAAGIFLLILRFDLLLLVALLLIVALSTAGNSFVRGSLACKFCRQREIGCPAEKLFSEKYKKQP